MSQATQVVEMCGRNGTLTTAERPVRHLVAISGGKDSTAMALRLAEIEPRTYEFLITPTQRELPTMKDHWKRLGNLLGSPLIIPPGPTLVEMIVRFKALPNHFQRWCTRTVKIEPFIAYASSAAPAVSYVGIRADEVIGDDAREGTDWRGVKGVTQDLPLVRWGWGLSKVVSYLAERNVVIPPRTDCDWCFFQRLIEWYELWRDWPDQWAEGEVIEKLYGHTFRSPSRDTWPTSMEGLRLRFEAGDIPLDTRLRKKNREAMCSWCAR